MKYLAKPKRDAAGKGNKTTKRYPATKIKWTQGWGVGKVIKN